MGGSGGGGGYPPSGAGTGGKGGKSCDFNFVTTIFGPVPGLANQLSVGDVLLVQLTAKRRLP